MAFFRNSKLVIDWHNFGYSLYALKFGISHPLVKLHKFYEFGVARFATAHFAVTNAMADDPEESRLRGVQPLSEALQVELPQAHRYFRSRPSRSALSSGTSDSG